MLCKTLDNGKQEIIELSHDHKPSNEEEKNRIHAAGSWVIFNRINGAIAISRAIGDWEYKDPSLYLKMAREKKKPVFNRLEAQKFQISTYPTVIKHPLIKENDYMIVACDGIWDVYTN